MRVQNSTHDATRGVHVPDAVGPENARRIAAWLVEPFLASADAQRRVEISPDDEDIVLVCEIHGLVERVLEVRVLRSVGAADGRVAADETHV